MRNAIKLLSILAGGMTPIVASAVVPATAGAGTYVAYACHTPSGRWASTEGWSAARYDTMVGVIARTYEDCAQAGQANPMGRLVAELREPPHWIDPARAGDYASWSVGGPDGTLVESARIGLCADAGAGTGSRVSIGPQLSWMAPGTALVAPLATGPGQLGCAAPPYWRAAPAGSSNHVDLPGLNAQRLYFTTWCVLEDCNPGSDPFVSVEVASAILTMRDDHPPTVERAAGTLASGDPQNGRLEISFNARDVGAGIFRSIVEVKVNQSGEWRQYAAPIVDRLGGRCAPAGETVAVHEFLYVDPCPKAVVDARATLDTSQLPAGDHLVRAQVEDGSGNRTDIVPARIVHVEDANHGRTLGRPQPPPPNNGTGASAKALVKLDRDGRTVGFRRRLDVRGRLVDEHDRPIAGARIEVDWRRLIPRRGVRGAPWRALGRITTGRNGRFVARMPTTSSRALRFSYKANYAQDGFTSAAQYGLRVRAHVRVRASSTRIRNGQAVVFAGRVAGTPRGGVPLSLQAWVTGRGWTPARTEQADPRTGAKGRFRVSYRFARTFERVVYRFRLVVGEDSNFPFVRSGSRRIMVVVRP